MDLLSERNTFVVPGTGEISLNLNKAGLGRLVFLGTNALTPVISVSGGILDIRHSRALGTATGVVLSGAALELRGGITVSNPLVITGLGFMPPVLANPTNALIGAIRSVGNNTLAGPVLLVGASRIQSDAGVLNIAGVLSNAANALTLGGAGDILVSGRIGGTGALTKDNTGTLKLVGTNAFGALTVRAGTVLLDYGAYAGPITNVVMRGTSAVTLGAVGVPAILVINGPASGLLTQDIAGVTIGVANAGLIVSNNNGTAIVNLGALSRAVGGGALDIILPTGTEQIRTTTATNRAGIFHQLVTIGGMDWAGTD
ncbi:MAG: hypothetical protein N3A53_09155, partial [Verrucomicrobiae bacterium]|nr:hypothetical protein [Verrucomicrobiae bacterium]